MPYNAKDHVQAYAQMVTTRLQQGFQGTFVSIMFNELAGSGTSQAKIMEDAAIRLYRQSVTRIIQYRGERTDLYQMPFWLLCSDFPVFKHDRDHLANIAMNEGRHLHGVLLVPPKNRLKTSLAEHFYEEDSQRRYHPLGGPIHRIHADPITFTPEKLVRYTLKSLERHRVENGDVIVLPRTHSEVAKLKPGETPRDAVTRRSNELRREENPERLRAYATTTPDRIEGQIHSRSTPLAGQANNVGLK